MNIIDTIRVEDVLIRWNDDGYPQEPFYARFGILETPEQDIAQREGLENGDKDWISFDENIFYWLTAYTGEKLSDHYPEKDKGYDFVVIPESEEVNG